MSGILQPFRNLRPPDTPKRRSFDYLRRWLDGEFNWRQQLKRAQLPEFVSKTIAEIVDRKELTKLEKAAITDDLVAHFQDGFDCGISYQTLVDDFGNTVLIGELIHRAKERNRTMFSAIFKISGVMLLGFGAVAAIFVGLFLQREATPSTDYLPEFNKIILEHPTEDFAWNIYRPMWIKYDLCGNDGGPIKDLWFDENDTYHGRLLKPGDDDWPKAAAILRQREDLLEAFRRGSKLPVMGVELKCRYDEYSELDQQALFPSYYAAVQSGEIDLSVEPSDKSTEPWNHSDFGAIIGVLLPHTQTLRNVGRLFVADTRLAIEENDSQRVLANIEATYGIAGQAAEYPVMVGALVGFAINSLANQQVEELLLEHPEFLSEQQWSYLQMVVADQDIKRFVKLDGELAMFEDIVQSVFTDEGDGRGKMTYYGLKIASGFVPNMTGHGEDFYHNTKPLDHATKVLELATTNRKATVETYRAIHAKFKDRFAVPFHESTDKFLEDLESFEMGETLEMDGVDTNGASRHLISCFFPAYGPVRMAQERTIVEHDSLELAIAIHRFRLANGELPESIEAVEGKFIESLPLDRVDGTPLKYAVDGDEFKIYSFGTDGVDDNGQMPLRDQKPIRFEFQADYDGDWVAWPMNWQRN